MLSNEWFKQTGRVNTFSKNTSLCSKHISTALVLECYSDDKFMYAHITKDSLLKCTKIRDGTESQQKLATFLYKTGISRDRFTFVIYLIPSNKILTHWKRLWCWEGLGAGGEGDDRGWDGWMASLTQWTWVWVSSNWQTIVIAKHFVY